MFSLVARVDKVPYENKEAPNGLEWIVHCFMVTSHKIYLIKEMLNMHFIEST